MLKIGSFSRIAGVSIRLLHYYEELDLFKPAHIDPETGYRYYKTSQIKNLNKILALKDLGLTLQQVKRYIQDEISQDELRGMLKLKKSQIYQTIEEELLRLRQIELRLKRLDDDYPPPTNDVIIKPIPAQHYFAARHTQLPVEQFIDFVIHITGSLHAQNIRPSGFLTVLEHSKAHPDDFFDLEVGFALPAEKELASRTLALSDNRSMVTRELPAIKQMATLLHIGTWGSGQASYFALGQWIEAHGYEVVGPVREVYMEMARNEVDNNIVEFQLPIQASERLFS